MGNFILFPLPLQTGFIGLIIPFVRPVRENFLEVRRYQHLPFAGFDIRLGNVIVIVFFIDHQGRRFRHQKFAFDLFIDIFKIAVKFDTVANRLFAVIDLLRSQIGEETADIG